MESSEYVPTENDIRIAIDVIGYLQQNPDVVQTSTLIRKLRYFCKVYINTKRKDKMREKKQRVIENDIAKLEKTGIRIGREERKKKTYERLKLQLPIEWHPQEMLPENPSEKEFVNLPSDQIREIESKSLPSTTPKPPDTLQTSYLDCYICKKSVKTVHHFYDQLCTSCGDLNFEKRHQTTSLEGKVALVTGGRIKIGYEVVLKLVRAGALVIVTTRFPKDAVLRFSAEKDFNEWSHRLHIYALDLRFIPSIEQFAEHLKATYSQLDIIIHNAAQTIRRPPIFYRHLIPIEKSLEFTDERKQGMIKSFAGSPMITEGGSEVSLIGQGELGQGISGLTALQKVNEKVPLVDITQIPLTPEDSTMDPSLFPVQEYDEHGQQADRRVDNTWFTRIEDVSTVEMAEVHIVNTMAPFILTSKLRPLLTKDKPTFIINVSSMEGKFSRTKTAYHPHTNMAKASLNMMTRTCSREFAMHNIYMNSVDTGWITYENPLEYDAVKQILKLSPPIDEIDGASRILDPIFHALETGENYWGLFYKDYMPSSW